MGTEEDNNDLTLQRLEALERENAELHHEVAELRGSDSRRGGSGRMIGKLTKRMRLAFASSGALGTVVGLLAVTAGVAVAAAVEGTFKGETLKGTEQGDIIDGYAGNDTIKSLGGDDVITGGEGIDKIYAGEGMDAVIGGEGNDVIDLGPGDDNDLGFGEGGPGNDTIKGGDGFDELFGEEGNDKLFGNAGSDRLNGGPGINTYSGGDGDDEINAVTNEEDQGAKETIAAGEGNDRIFAFDFVPDVIDCGPGEDVEVEHDEFDTTKNCEG